MKNPIDELAKTLAMANGLPRRDALRLIGGTLAGGVLATFGVGKAFAKDPNLGNSPCAHYCQDHFPPGADRGKCVSDGAHGTGACYGCGGPFELTGTCLECGPGGACIAPPVCGSGCVCFATVDGGSFCHEGQPCAGSQGCVSSADCPPGFACSNVTCCGAISICIQPCGGPLAPAAAGPSTVSA